MSTDKMITAAAYAVAVLAVIAMVYLTPGIFVGLVGGYLLGKNWDKIQKWADDPI